MLALCAAREFELIFGTRTWLTLHAFPAASTAVLSPPSSPGDVPPVVVRHQRVPTWPRSLGPLSRCVYRRVLRRLPPMAARGEAFLARIDVFVEEAFVPLVRSWMRATKFDLLGFEKHHIALFFFAYPSVVPNSNSDSLTDQPQDNTDGAARLEHRRLADDDEEGDEDDAFEDAIEDTSEPNGVGNSDSAIPSQSGLFNVDKVGAQVIYAMARGCKWTGDGRFAGVPSPGCCTPETSDAANPQQTSDLRECQTVDEEVESRLRELRYRDFVESWVKAGRSIRALLATVAPGAPGSLSAGGQTYGPALFAELAREPQFDRLPPAYLALCHDVIRGLAVTLDNVFDDGEWRERLRAIWARMPLTLIVGSLRLVNPVPFVERLLRLFVWRPRGVHSLLQRLCGILCASDRTVSRLKELAAELGPDACRRVEAAVAPLVAELDADEPAASGAKVDDATLRSMLAAAGVDVVGGSGSPGLAERAGRHNPRHPRRHHHHHHHHHHPQHQSAQTHANAHDQQQQQQQQYRATGSAAAVATAAEEYARKVLRRAEKAHFIDVVGSQGTTDFIVHMAAVLPPLLAEMWACTDMADLTKTFFATITGCLDALNLYDTPDGTTAAPSVVLSAASLSSAAAAAAGWTMAGAGARASPASTSSDITLPPPAAPVLAVREAAAAAQRAEVVKRMEASVLQLFQRGYGMSYSLARRAPAGPGGIHAAVDWMARELAGADSAAGARGLLELSAAAAAEEALAGGLGNGARREFARRVVTGLSRSGTTDEGAWVLGHDGGGRDGDADGEGIGSSGSARPARCRGCAFGELSGCTHCGELMLGAAGATEAATATAAATTIDRMVAALARQLGVADPFAELAAGGGGGGGGGGGFGPPLSLAQRRRLGSSDAVAVAASDDDAAVF
ncbi:hypothetical protein HK405_007816, partial [Cladochytrium tenue]